MIKPRYYERIIAIALFTSLIAVWWYAIFITTSEKHQGDVYRILYIHVPAAATAFITSFGLMIQGVLSLRQPQSHWIFVGKALAEVGLLFTTLTLITGSLWGRPTWGVWWVWDPRITTTFLLALLYIGYLLLWNSITNRDTRVKVCGVMGVLIAVDIPIIYQSVTWWRTLHQPPSLFRSQGSTMDPQIQLTLLISTIITIGLAWWLIYYRTQGLKTQNILQQQVLKNFR